MRILALLAVCSVSCIAPLTVEPKTQTLPKEYVYNAKEYKQYRVVKRSLFFVERTITIPAGTVPAHESVEFIVFEAEYRHTKTNAVRTDHSFGEYKYLFAPDKDIEIFDRSANMPIWYVIAVGATVVAMVGFYMIVKKGQANKADAIQTGTE